MFEYEGGVEIESEGGDDVQLDGNRREDAGCRVGPRDWRNLHVFLLECLVSHFLQKLVIVVVVFFDVAVVVVERPLHPPRNGSILSSPAKFSF